MKAELMHTESHKAMVEICDWRAEIISTFIRERSTVFNELMILRKRGWENPAGDTFFKKRRQVADNADAKTKLAFLNIMQEIAEQMDAKMDIIGNNEATRREFHILDLCLAPGGFAKYFKNSIPNSKVWGFSLPKSSGGHEVLLDLRQNWLEVTFQDVTMLMDEILGGASDQSESVKDHIEAEQLRSQWPYSTQKFDLVICDGQVLRTHQRAEYRQSSEPKRLALSQLIIALQRLTPGGTLIMLLHKIEAWDNIQVLSTFQQFSDICFFKPKPYHAIQSSFYLVAKNVRSESSAALDAIMKWREAWKAATFEGPLTEYDTEEEIMKVLGNFGDAYVKMAEPVFEIQKLALERSSFCKARPLK
ncbi:hypothetical protein EJ05DRAFT_484757 [Pseudovirgaria hyperparasitica]|uniref:Ribosomal RNA methyltransferase FtsJ domain-containing protein n=1 Tax=Pseudovirgaria hyperparasitica TaxID=470096 RepID=A0A6A6WCF5_9PEZI|nr:uncharacterized protein EJ05DRAFT_484757 [Pseudovirgaria hyperparasitica]KAF2759859.1 hypothetical protein EJ05DRAFT_484757 [Pseudovirgaria hyperparasitica]